MKKTISLVIIIGLVASLSYLIFEPEIAKGTAANADIGVLQTVTAEITLACDGSVNDLDPIPGMSGGTSDGSFSCTTTTNNDTGYSLRLRKAGLLCHGAGCVENQQFDDYPGPTDNPIHYNWQDAGAGAEYWGFNMTSGVDVTQRFRNASGPAAPCNTEGGVVTPGQCWVRIPTDSPGETVASRGIPTPVGGIASGFGVRIQAGSNNLLRSGNYTTTLVVTAAMN